jgi:predicted PurR-regulated permease PerM
MVAGLSGSRSRLAWILCGAVLAVALGFVAYSFVGTFVFAVFLYYATRPVYTRLKTYTRYNHVAAAGSLLTLALPVLLLLTYTVGVALQEFNNAVEQLNTDGGTTSLEGLQNYLSPYIDASSRLEDPATLLSDPQGFLQQPGVTDAVQRTFEEGLGYAVGVGGFVGNLLLHLFIMIAVAYYLLVDGRRLSRWFQNVFADDRGVMDQFVRSVDRDFQNVFFGNILNAFLTATIGAIAYSVLDVVAPAAVGVPYPVLLGLLAGAASLIPVVGMKIVYVPVVLYLSATAVQVGGTSLLWFPLVFGLVSFVIVDVVPDLGLRPYVSGRNLHTGAVMLAYILGPLLFGWYGLFLGPIVLVLSVHFARVVVPELVDQRRFAPYGIDPGYVEFLGNAEPSRPRDRRHDTSERPASGKTVPSGPPDPSPEDPAGATDGGRPSSQGPPGQNDTDTSEKS